MKFVSTTRPDLVVGEAVRSPELLPAAKGLIAYLYTYTDLKGITAHSIGKAWRADKADVELWLYQLEAHGLLSDTGVTPSHLAAEPQEKSVKVDKRDPDVSKVYDYFETTFNLTMPRVKQNRAAASTLIKQYGPLEIESRINAAANIRGRQYAPLILTLEDLRDKMLKLEAFYQREGKALAEDKQLEASINRSMN